jgi:ribose-phosphate pyrophosphokinase
MKIFSGSSNRFLAEKIAKNLKIQLSNLEIFKFPDGEKRIRILDEVLNENVFVVQSTSSPADQNYMELFFIVDALKRASARSITAIIPYLGYQRQDHLFRSGEAVSLQVIVETLEAIGVSEVITVDLHSIKIPELFHLPIKHLSALPLFAEKIKKEKWDDGKTVLVSPDMGGIRRIKQISEMLSNMPYIVIEKNRDLSTGEVNAEKMEGEILPRAIIIDDMISSGQTMIKATRLLLEKGAKEVFVFATHPVFSNDSKEILQKSSIGKVFITDSIYVSKEKLFPKLEILSVSELITKNIKSA